MKKILYVEDDKDIANAVKIILNNHGFNTEIVHCGKDCIDLLKEDFDVYLLDIMLPDMSGWDLFNTIKENKSNSKFVFLSAIPISQERMEELKKAGISDYITKPFNREDLIKRLRRIFNNKILYIEDIEDTAENVKNILSDSGFRIDVTLSGREGLKKAEDFYDLIILDMMLPDMSGWDIYEMLNNKCINTKFVFLTSIDADLNRITELKNYGISDYIKKPFIKEDLVKKVHNILI